MTYILAIDVETTGQGLRTNFMTCIGAALVDPAGKVVATFESYLRQPEGTGWETRCVDEFWSKFPDLFEKTRMMITKAPPPREVMERFKRWVLAATKDKTCVVVFDTAGFDHAWIDYYLEDTSCSYLLGYYQAPRCISSYMLGAAKAPLTASSEKAFTAATKKEFPRWDVSHDHNPVNDATCIALNAWWIMGQL